MLRQAACRQLGGRRVSCRALAFSHGKDAIFNILFAGRSFFFLLFRFKNVLNELKKKEQLITARILQMGNQT